MVKDNRFQLIVACFRVSLGGGVAQEGDHSIPLGTSQNKCNSAR